MKPLSRSKTSSMSSIGFFGIEVDDDFHDETSRKTVLKNS